MPNDHRDLKRDHNFDNYPCVFWSKSVFLRSKMLFFKSTTDLPEATDGNSTQAVLFSEKLLLRLSMLKRRCIKQSVFPSSTSLRSRVVWRRQQRVGKEVFGDAIAEIISVSAKMSVL